MEKEKMSKEIIRIGAMCIAAVLAANTFAADAPAAAPAQPVVAPSQGGDEGHHGMRGIMHQIMSKADKDGGATFEEVIAIDKNFTKEKFDQLDANKDGKLDKAELVALFRKNRGERSFAGNDERGNMRRGMYGHHMGGMDGHQMHHGMYGHHHMQYCMNGRHMGRGMYGHYMDGMGGHHMGMYGHHMGWMHRGMYGHHMGGMDGLGMILKNADLKDSKVITKDEFVAAAAKLFASLDKKNEGKIALDAVSAEGPSDMKGKFHKFGKDRHGGHGSDAPAADAKVEKKE